MKPCIFRIFPTIVELSARAGAAFWSHCRPCVLAVLLLTGAVGASAQSTTDYDDDNNGLIDIRTLAQLNAMRWDLDGNGVAASSATTTYNAAFPSAAARHGLPGHCRGRRHPSGSLHRLRAEERPELRHRRQRFHLGGHERHGDQRRQRRLPQRRQRLAAHRHQRCALQHDVRRQRQGRLEPVRQPQRGPHRAVRYHRHGGAHHVGGAGERPAPPSKARTRAWERWRGGTRAGSRRAGRAARCGGATRPAAWWGRTARPPARWWRATPPPRWSVPAASSPAAWWASRTSTPAS